MKKLIHTMLKAGPLFLIITFMISTGCQQQPDYSKELKPLFEKYYDVWRTGNLDDLNAIMDPNFTRHSDPGTSAEGLVNLKKLISEFRAIYPDFNLESNEEIYSENKFAGRWTITFPSASAGREISIWGVNIIHFKNGKIVEEWDGFDNQSFMEQLGYIMMPPAAEKE